MGMPSITRRRSPLPKLLVTRRSCGAMPPQLAQTGLDEIDRDDVERPGEPDFDDCFGLTPVERAATDNDFGFIGFSVLLSFDNVASEDYIFKIKN